jgi:hypothetical protein
MWPSCVSVRGLGVPGATTQVRLAVQRPTLHGALLLGLLVLQQACRLVQMAEGMPRQVYHIQTSTALSNTRKDNRTAMQCTNPEGTKMRRLAGLQ